MLSSAGRVIFTCIIIQIPLCAVSGGYCANCKKGCDADTGRCDGQCERNYYGTKCEKLCPRFCESQCDKLTGECLSCTGGFYGKNCSKYCPYGCVNRCDQDTGVCNRCHSDVYGKFCNNTCPENCLHGCRGENGKCKSCVKGFWGSKCNRECPSTCIECMQKTGACIGCKPKFYGDLCSKRCQITHCRRCTWNEDAMKEICYECDSGYYGEICDQRCSSFCNSKWCNQYDGKCAFCKNGWYGEKCDKQCYKNCLKCKDGTTCKECVYGFYGDHCENKCSSACEECSRDGGTCYACVDKNAKPYYEHNCECTKTQCEGDPSRCYSCKSPHWFPAGSVCCPCKIKKCRGSNPFDSCGENANNTCKGLCQPGFYGEYCSLKCSEHCGGDQNLCDRKTGRCTEPCEDGWIGKRCNIHCNYYFPHCTKCVVTHNAITNFDVNKCLICEVGHHVWYQELDVCIPCQHCANNTCDSITGECLDGCAEGYYYGGLKQCVMSCAHRCVGGICNSDGTCIQPGCNPGYYGKKRCDRTCPSGCLNNTCDAVTGNCLDGCKRGSHGKKCTSVCKNCLNDVCNHKTGICVECKSGFWGDDCTQPCNGCINGACVAPYGCRDGCKPRMYSKYCNKSCPDQCVVCDQFFGTCTECQMENQTNCLNSTTINWNQLSAYPSLETCSNSMYGTFCDKPCPSGCLPGANQASSCDRFMGACLFTGCKNGFYGMYCDRNCSSCKSNDEDTPACDREHGLCSSCIDGFYGTECNKICEDTCKYGVCERNSGRCSHGCKQGWGGHQCQDMKETGKRTTTKTFLILIGFAVGIILIVFIVYTVCKHRNKREQYTTTSTDEQLFLRLEEKEFSSLST